MPHLIKVYIRQVVIGFLISAAFVSLLLGMNVANLWHLVSNTSGGWLAVLMLWIFNGIVFGGVQFAIALESRRRNSGGGRRDALLQRSVQPIPLHVEKQPVE